MSWIQASPQMAAAFLGSSIEAVEAMTIVLAAGVVRGWRTTRRRAGALLHRPLARVPENTLKYIVGIMLTAFGWFWFGEGIGIQWRYGDAAILGLIAVVYVTSALAVRSIRRVRALADANIEGRP